MAESGLEVCWLNEVVAETEWNGGFLIPQLFLGREEAEKGREGCGRMENEPLCAALLAFGRFLGMCHVWLLHFQHRLLLCSELSVSGVFWNALQELLSKGEHRPPKHRAALLLRVTRLFGLKCLNDYQDSFYCSLDYT